MDILEIDAVNFAGRVAHVAAAELCGLLATGEILPDPLWFSPGVPVDEPALSQAIDDMAAYVHRHLCTGETLYREFRGPDWGGQSSLTRMCYDLFASTVASVSTKLLAVQKNAERQAAAPPPPPPVQIEDTIFEPVGSLGELRPEAVEAARLQASARNAAIDEPPTAPEPSDNQGAKIVEEAVPSRIDATAAEAAEIGNVNVMSIGEPPAKPPVFRGGRGHRKRG